MAQAARSQPHLTLDEYFKLEASASVRHEHVGGVLYALAGASRRHGRLVGNIRTILEVATRDKECEVYSESTMLRIGNDVVYYPDIMVVCDPEDRDPIYCVNPCLIIDVLSPMTASIDRREKAMAYRRIRDLHTYLIVYQDELHIERHTKNDAGAWEFFELHRQGRVPLGYPGIELTLDDQYQGIEI